MPFGIGLGDVVSGGLTKVADATGVVGWAGDAVSGGEGHNPNKYTWDDSQLELQRQYQEQARKEQGWLEQEYLKRIMGKSPSIAEGQLNEGMNAAMAQQVAASRGATGSGAARGAAQYNAARVGADIAQKTAASAATLRAQEQTAAEQGLASMYQSKRQMDQNQYANEAQNQQGKAGAWNQNELGWAQQSEQAASRRQQGNAGLFSMAGGIGSALVGGSDENLKENIRPAKDPTDWLMGVEPKTFKYRDPSLAAAGGVTSVSTGLPVSPNNEEMRMAAEGYQLPTPPPGGYDSYYARMAGQPMQDDELKYLERLMAEGDAKVAAARSGTKPAYPTTSTAAPSVPGGSPPPKPTELGVIAQDLERTPEGRRMVVNTPTGKAIDPARAVGPMMAAESDMAKRLRAVEAKVGGKPPASPAPKPAAPPSPAAPPTRTRQDILNDYMARQRARDAEYAASMVPSAEELAYKSAPTPSPSTFATRGVRLRDQLLATLTPEQKRQMALEWLNTGTGGTTVDPNATTWEGPPQRGAEPGDVYTTEMPKGWYTVDGGRQ